MNDLDLSAYRHRIHDSGPTVPNRALLNRLIASHVEHIPFENLDVLLDRPIELAPHALFDKLVSKRRGGYCFEQNRLFGLILQQLGFEVIPLSARVRIERSRSFVPPRTHLFNRVELEGESWLIDVGVGGLSPTCALKLVLDTPQPTPHEARRIVAQGEWDGFDRRAPDAVLFHQAKLGDHWQDVCEFTLEPMHTIDCELGNWFTSAHPSSHFKSKLMVARATPQGRITLLNRDLKFRDQQGRTRTERIRDPEHLKRCLLEHFGIESPTDKLTCSALDWSVA